MDGLVLGQLSLQICPTQLQSQHLKEAAGKYSHRVYGLLCGIAALDKGKQAAFVVTC